MTSNARMWHRRHHDFEKFDYIELVVVPRYKTSGFSGDEWRTSVRARFYFKGEVVHETSYSDMHHAVMLLAHEYVTCNDHAIPDCVIELEREGRCDQPGCPLPSVSRYKLKELFSAQGERLDQGEARGDRDSYAQFCAGHLRRGDCGREDSDRNYEVLSGPGPEGSRNVIESPSVFGGVIEPEIEEP